MSNTSRLLPENIRLLLADNYRLAALKQSGMIGRQKLVAFEGIGKKAAEIFQAPVAQITFLEKDEQWISMSLGFDIQCAPTATSFCAHTIADTHKPMVILDALLDENFRENPFVRHPPYVRFYAGTVIRYNEQNIGTLCIYDFNPRLAITSQQATMLLQLARDAEGVIAELELDRAR